MAATVAPRVAGGGGRERAAGVADLRLPVQREAAGRVLQLVRVRVRVRVRTLTRLTLTLTP